jgi:hypothetical protein
MIGTKNNNQEEDNKPFQKRRLDPLTPKEKQELHSSDLV